MSTPASSEMARLIEAAEQHGFALPRCNACGHRFYPPQSWCPECLAPEIEYVADRGHATVLSMIRIHRSLENEWRGRLPVYVACVRTDSGVSLFAIAEGNLPTGTPVTVRPRDNLFHADVRS